jgi:hypothetical protein
MDKWAKLKDYVINMEDENSNNFLNAVASMVYAKTRIKMEKLEKEEKEEKDRIKEFYKLVLDQISIINDLKNLFELQNLNSDKIIEYLTAFGDKIDYCRKELNLSNKG